MKWTVRFTKPSIEDVRQAIQYHKGEEPPQDRDFLASLRKTVQHISDFPEAAPLVQSKLFKRNDKVREFPCGPYRFVYIFQEDVCWVLAVVHGSRNFFRAWREQKRPIPPQG